jgi:hypothetical protein
MEPVANLTGATPTLRGGLGSSPFPFITIAADGGCVELAGYSIFPGMINREDNLPAWKFSATESTADGNLALLVGVNRYVVGDLPVTNFAQRQRACGCSNVVLLRLMHLAFRKLYPSAGRRLHTQTNTGDHSGIVCYAVGYRGAGDACAGRRALGKYRTATAKDRCADGERQQ